MGLQGGILCLCAAAAMALLMLAAPAYGAEPTRRDFVDRAEAICKGGTTNVSPMLSDALAEFKKNEVKVAGPKFSRGADTYDAMRARLAALPRPLADADLLTEWLKQLEVQNSFLRKTGQALAAAQRVKAQGFLSRFVHNGNLANDLVLGFGFKYCLFNNKFK
jgi:hypothetical protein